MPAPFDNKKQARSAFPMRSAPRSAVEICPMSVIIALAALGLLMLAAYRGYSVIQIGRAHV